MMSGRRAVLGLWILAIALLAGLGAAYIWLRPATGPPAPRSVASPAPSSGTVGFSRLIGRRAPDFALLDQFGHEQRMSRFRGKSVMLTFADSRCTTVCPLTALLLRHTMDLLGPKAHDTEVVAVNANARYSSVGDVLRWSRRHDMTHRWLFLTGPPVGPRSGPLSGLPSVWNAYGIRGGETHTTVVFVIDPSGRIRTAAPIAGRGSLQAEASALAKYVSDIERQTA